MKVRITASCIWNVDNQTDEGIAQQLIDGEVPDEVILDYLSDAHRGDSDMSDFEVSVTEVVEE